MNMECLECVLGWATKNEKGDKLVQIKRLKKKVKQGWVWLVLGWATKMKKGINWFRLRLSQFT